MTKVIVASTNPNKVESAKRAFKVLFPNQNVVVEGIEIPATASSQPLGDAETQNGAKRRAEVARGARPFADYWVGIEGGCAQDDQGLGAFSWITILNSNKSSSSKTATFYLPDDIAEMIRHGNELSEACDTCFGSQNTGQGEGAVGILTGGAINRATYYTHAIVLALIPFLKPELYENKLRAHSAR